MTPAPVWPVDGEFVVLQAGVGASFACIAFGRGKTGRVVLITLGDKTEGEPIDKRFTYLDDQYHEERARLAEDYFARHAPGGSVQPPVHPSVICAAFIQENLEILRAAMTRKEGGR